MGEDDSKDGAPSMDHYYDPTKQLDDRRKTTTLAPTMDHYYDPSKNLEETKSNRQS